MDHEKFIYRKEQRIREHRIKYAWFLINKESRNGVTFCGNKYDAEMIAKSRSLCRDNHFGFGAHGIECHASTGSGAPSCTDCQVTGGECWYNSAILYAEESLSGIDPDNCDSKVWGVLHSVYQSHFEEGQ